MTKQVKLLDLEPAQFLAVCYTNSELKDKLNTVIYDAFNDFEFGDMIKPYFKNGVRDYSIGLYNQNYFDITDEAGFMEDVADHIKELATSEPVIKAYNHCKALRDKDSNLFAYTVQTRLKEAVLAEINHIARYYEDLSYCVYCNDIEDEHILDYVDSDIIGCELWPFDEIAIDLITGEIVDYSEQTFIDEELLEQIKQAVTAAEQSRGL